LRAIAGDHFEFHGFLKRFDYYLLSATSEAATLAWLYDDVFQGKAWSPKQSDINFYRQVPTPPRRNVLVRHLLSLMGSANFPETMRMPFTVI
jgi:hypothetical protein